MTRAELREEIERLEIRIDHKLTPMATKADLEIWGGALFEHLMTELSRHAKAVQESLPTQVSAIDDKYADLPARVSHLETAVFAPEAR